MQHIFLTLAIVSHALLLGTFLHGWTIDDAFVVDPEVQSTVNVHFLTGLGALVCGVLLHALVLTYFMGTGRWLEETAKAYRLDADYFARHKSLKYRTLPVMILCITGLVLIGAAGGAADPASPSVVLPGSSPSGAQLHFWTAVVACLVNLAGTAWEYRSLKQTAGIIQSVLDRVAEVRAAHGLPVEARGV